MRADTIVDTNGDTIFPIAGGLPDNAVTTAKIQDDAVTTAKLASNAVTNSQLIDGSIGGDKIDDGAVDSLKFASGAVTTAKIADNAVTSGKFNTGAVIGGKVASSQVTPAKMSLTESNVNITFTSGSATATKSAKLISLGSKLWMLTYRGNTGITTSAHGNIPIGINYSGIFNGIYAGLCKHSKSSYPDSRTVYAVFDMNSADTYANVGTDGSSSWHTEIMIIGARAV